MHAYETNTSKMNSKGLAIIGDAWHAAAPLYMAIVRQMEAKGIQTDVVYDNDVPFDKFDEYDIIVVSRYGIDDLYNFENNLFLKGSKWKETIWITKEQENKFEEYVRNGGKLFMHHDGHCYYYENGAITQLAKATHEGHPERVEIEIYPTGDSPDLTTGIEPFKIKDEEFQMQIQDSTTIFLKSHSEQHGTTNQGWAHDYGEGKVVVLVPGHYSDGLEHKMVRKLISNAIDYLKD
tara:strand:+ start:203 stop:907 length:705 start_codon:yes stop_codon:yes gene_type:complete